MSDPRDKILSNIESILIGPRHGEEEIVEGRSVLLNYIAGKLFAQETSSSEIAIEEYESTEGNSPDSTIDSSTFGPDANDPVSQSFQILPSSAGLSFCVKEDARFKIKASAGIYQSYENKELENQIKISALEKFGVEEEGSLDRDKLVEYQAYIEKQKKKLPKQFKRRQLEESFEINFANEKSSLLTLDCFDEKARIVIKKIKAGSDHILTVTIINQQEKQKKRFSAVTTTLFQVALECKTIESKIPPFPIAKNTSLDLEELEFDLRYRETKPFARGWNVSVDWQLDEQGKNALSVSTSFFPRAYVNRALFETPAIDGKSFSSNDVFKLSYLADETQNKEEIIKKLNQFADYFEVWIEQLENQSLQDDLSDIADKVKKKINLTLDRIREGIQLLKENEDVFAAFQLANLAMLIQMIHQMRNAEGFIDLKDANADAERINYLSEELLDSERNIQWRPFQLAYFLLVVPTLVDKNHEYRDTVDLIWFQTGGGKTEAYFLIAAFEMIFRRIKYAEKGLGTAVINRYTYRFLTTDQFTRTAALICALERIRRKNPTQSEWVSKIDIDPFTLGLWVGQKLTPNKVRDHVVKNRDISAKGRLEDMMDLVGERQFLNSFQIEGCPSCATRLFPKEKETDPNGNTNRSYWGFDFQNNDFYIKCPNHDCLFHDSGDGLPLLMIDDQIFRNPPTFLVGTVDKFARLPWEQRSKKLLASETQLPPSLIIQDELHLISGALGTIASIYESAIDCVINIIGESKPKYIAATATIRNSDEQCRRIFARDAKIFPSPGLTMDDSFFSIADKDQSTSRLYTGIMSSGVKNTVAAYKVMAAMLQSINEVDLTTEERDAFWTLIAYHNSKRELGRTISTYSDEIPDQIKTYAHTEDVTRNLRGEPFEVSANAVKSISEARSALLEKHDPPETEGYDFVPSTNMISVGIDIQRLSYMFVNGHPKLNSEYIQATSRVGRSKISGLIVTNYSAFKPRDRSYYEQFKNYHETIHRSVEPTSVTPGSKNALNRALHASLIILIRFATRFNENDDAQKVDIESIQDVLDLYKERLTSAYREEEDEQQAISDKIEQTMERWVHWIEEAQNMDVALNYISHSNAIWPLMKRFDHPMKRVKSGWMTLDSMRNVDQEISLRGNIDDD